MSFLVVEFHKTNDVAVISKAWLNADNQVTWPVANQSKFNRLLRNHQKPEEGQFLLMEAKILKASKTFEQAKAIERKAEYQSSLSTDLDCNAPTKRRRRKPERFLTTSSSDGSDVGSEISTSKEEDLFDYSSFKKQNFGCSQMSASSSKTAFCNNSSVLASSDRRNCCSSVEVSELYRKMKKLSDKMTDQMRQMSNVCNTVIPSLLATTNERLDRMEFKMDNYARSQNTLTGNENIRTARCANRLLPINDREQFKDVNAKLREESTYLEMVNDLSLVHRGSNVNECVRRTCQAVFHHEFARSANWSGANNKTKIGGSLIERAIYDAAMSESNYPKESKSTLKQILLRWFTGADDRQGGRKVRRIRKEAGISKSTTKRQHVNDVIDDEV